MRAATLLLLATQTDAWSDTKRPAAEMRSDLEPDQLDKLKNDGDAPFPTKTKQFRTVDANGAVSDTRVEKAADETKSTIAVEGPKAAGETTNSDLPAWMPSVVISALGEVGSARNLVLSSAWYEAAVQEIKTAQDTYNGVITSLTFIADASQAQPVTAGGPSDDGPWVQLGHTFGIFAIELLAILVILKCVVSSDTDDKETQEPATARQGETQEPASARQVETIPSSEANAEGAGRPGEVDGPTISFELAWIWWMASSLSMIIFNKYLLNADRFPYPLCLTMWHQFVLMLTTQVVRVTFLGPTLMPAVSKPGAGMANLSLKQLIGVVIPLACVTAVGIALSQKGILYLTISQIQLMKCAKPIAVFITSASMGFDKGNMTSFMWVVGVSIGMALATVADLHIVWVGVVYQLVSSTSDVVRVCMLKVLVSMPKLDPFSALHVMAPIIFFFLLMPCLLTEWTPLIGNLFWTWRWMLLANGLCALSLNAATVTFMKLGTPTLFTLSSMLTAAILLFCDWLLFGTVMNRMQLTGIGIAMVCAKLFDNARASSKQQEAEQAQAPTPLRNGSQ